MAANADRRSASAETAEMLQNDDVDLTLNEISFCEGLVSYSKCLLKAGKIASPYAFNEKEIDEALESSQQRFFATRPNKVGEQYDEKFWSQKMNSNKHRPVRKLQSLH